VIGGAGDEEIHFEPVYQPQIAGTLEGQIGALDAALRSRVDIWGIGVFAIAAGSLTQYLRLPTQLVGFTGESSKGKTTAQRIAGSGWGNSFTTDGKNPLTPLRSTENGLEAILEAHNGVTFLGDEMQLMLTCPHSQGQ